MVLLTAFHFLAAVGLAKAALNQKMATAKQTQTSALELVVGSGTQEVTPSLLLQLLLLLLEVDVVPGEAGVPALRGLRIAAIP